MTTLWRKFQVPGKLDVFLFDKLYRKGPASVRKVAGDRPVRERIEAAFQPVEFLEVDLLKGSPVDTTITSRTPDPYLERWAASSAPFSTENMLREIKKVVKALGGGIMKKTKKSKGEKLDLEDVSLPMVNGGYSTNALAEEVEAQESTAEASSRKRKSADGDGIGKPAKRAAKAGTDGEVAQVAKTPAKKAALVRPLGKVSSAAVSGEHSGKSVVSKDAATPKTLTSRGKTITSKDTAGAPPSGTTKLLFSNVSAQDEEFRSLIKKQVPTCGPYVKCFMTSRGKGIVLVADEAVAQEYVSHFNGYELNGEAMSVAIATRVSKDDAKKAHMPTKDSFKWLMLVNIPKKVSKASVQKALEAVSGAGYKSLEQVEEGKWKVVFDSVPDFVKFNALVNGSSLVFSMDGKTKKAKVKCESPSFGKKAAHAGRVFVQNLPFGVTAAQLEKLVHSFDKGAKVHLPGDGKKGFAFVQFSNLQVAEKAILRLNGSSFLGRTIRLALSLPTELYSDKGKVDKKSSVEDLGGGSGEDSEDDAAESIGEDDIDAVPEGKTDSQDNRKPASVSGSKKDESGRTIFVRNLSYESTETALREYFSTFGTVESCKICKDAKGVSRGTAFVLFASEEDARKVLAAEELALERDAEFAATEAAAGGRNKVKRSQAAGLGFSLDGRRLRLSMALSRDEAGSLPKSPAKNHDAGSGSKKRADLLMAGVIVEGSAEFERLTPAEQKLQLASLKEKQEKMKNPNMFLNPKRLCVRNLPPNADVNELRRHIAAHFRRNVDLQSICGEKKVDASRLIGKVTFLSDEKRKVKVGEATMRRRMPFAFVDFEHEELAREALGFLSCNADIYGARNRLFAEFAIEDSRALYIQNKRKEQYATKLQAQAGPEGEKRKKCKTYSRGKLQRMKRRKLRAEKSAEAK
ncbi:RNA binding protein, putative [Babesia caballi]|uniref:RNA binding protein, putative n=1 Tax=Babesia caballi TaxID=5871 RepID=A0AAV4M092_BABCB|nr:RNA binding protein, putative [Babesia caballi]